MKKGKKSRNLAYITEKAPEGIPARTMSEAEAGFSGSADFVGLASRGEDPPDSSTPLHGRPSAWRALASVRGAGVCASPSWRRAGVRGFCCRCHPPRIKPSAFLQHLGNLVRIIKVFAKNFQSLFRLEILEGAFYLKPRFMLRG